LPAFPWDSLAPAKAIAASHPGGIVDLSIGTPVDPVPEIIREALASASDSPGYPLTKGTDELRTAAADWLARRHNVAVRPYAIIPSIGSKELVAWLPTLLGCGPGDAVCFPELAYPTYDIGARMAGATPVPTDEPEKIFRGERFAERAASDATVPQASLAWVNSPSNPTGAITPPERLRELVAWARQSGVVLASDECYIDLGYDDKPISILHPQVSGGSQDGLLAVFSLSKRSNLAGYRAGFVAGDVTLVSELLEARKHAGMIVPAPVQAAMTVALRDDDHAAEQHARYARRRDQLRPALEQAGFLITSSQAGLYLWANHPDHADCWESVNTLAEAGILVSPGAFYGTAGHRHVRVALTATDERISAAVSRLAELAA
jgi:succinyldiaminopimelate transaminase